MITYYVVYIKYLKYYITRRTKKLNYVIIIQSYTIIQL